MSLRCQSFPSKITGHAAELLNSVRLKQRRGKDIRPTCASAETQVGENHQAHSSLISNTTTGHTQNKSTDRKQLRLQIRTLARSQVSPTRLRRLRRVSVRAKISEHMHEREQRCLFTTALKDRPHA